MKFAMECSVNDPVMLASQMDDAQDNISGIYTSPTSGSLAEIMTVFRDNLYELGQEAGDSYYRIDNDISAAESAKTKNYSEIDRLKNEISKAYQKIENLRERLSKLNNAKARYSAARAMVKGDSESASSTRSYYDSMISSVNESINDTNNEIEQWRRYIQECEDRIKKIEGMIANLECIISNARNSRSAIENHVQKCETLVSCLESMLSDVGVAYSEYQREHTSVKSSAESARRIADALNGYFFELTNSTVLDSERIKIASSDYFRRIAKSFTTAKETFRDTGARLFDSMNELKSIISDDVIRDSAEYLAEIDDFVDHAADDFGTKSEKFYKCANLVDSYTDLA